MEILHEMNEKMNNNNIENYSLYSMQKYSVQENYIIVNNEIFVETLKALISL